MLKIIKVINRISSLGNRFIKTTNKIIWVGFYKINKIKNLIKLKVNIYKRVVQILEELQLSLRKGSLILSCNI